MIKKQIFYITKDGKQFETKAAAQQHERTKKAAERLEKFLDETFTEGYIEENKDFINNLLDAAADLAEAMKEPKRTRQRKTKVEAIGSGNF